MESNVNVLEHYASRRRELLKRAAGGAVTVGPAMALLLEGTLKPKRAAAYALLNCGTAGVVTTTPASTSTGTGGPAGGVQF